MRHAFYLCRKSLLQCECLFGIYLAYNDLRSPCKLESRHSGGLDGTRIRIRDLDSACTRQSAPPSSALPRICSRVGPHDSFNSTSLHVTNLSSIAIKEHTSQSLPIRTLTEHARANRHAYRSRPLRKACKAPWMIGAFPPPNAADIRD